MEDRQPLEGLVAAIVSEEELAITLGSRDGVTKGMKFIVLAQTPLEIRHPVSNKLLKTLDRPKAYVKASDVDEEVTICRTYRTYTVGGSFSSTVMDWMQPTRRVREKLKAEDAAVSPPLDESESYVKVGDRVKALLEEDDRNS